MEINKTKRKISAALKSQIMSESFLLGSVVSKIAKSYGISPETIYNWHRKEKKANTEEVLSNDSSLSSKFVELTVDSKEGVMLKKAELIFADFSLSIEGKVNISSLFSILKILEESC